MCSTLFATQEIEIPFSVSHAVDRLRGRPHVERVGKSRNVVISKASCRKVAIARHVIVVHVHKDVVGYRMASVSSLSDERFDNPNPMG